MRGFVYYFERLIEFKNTISWRLRIKMIYINIAVYISKCILDFPLSFMQCTAPYTALFVSKTEGHCVISRCIFSSSFAKNVDTDIDMAENFQCHLHQHLGGHMQSLYIHPWTVVRILHKTMLHCQQRSHYLKILQLASLLILTYPLILL